MAEHEKELEDLNAKFEAEKARTALALQDKLAERKRKKQADLQSKQESELQKEKQEQRVELAQLQTQHAKSAEHEAMVSAIQQNPTQVPTMIQDILEQRHRKERDELEAYLASEERIALSDAKINLQEQLNGKLEALSQSLADQMREIEASASRLSEDQIDELKLQAQLKYKAKEQECQEWFSGELAASERQLRSKHQLRATDERLSMSERHYREYLEALQKLSPEHAKSASGKQAEEAAKELEEMRRKLDEQRKRQEQMISQERADFEEEQKKKLEADLADYEQQLEQETAAEKLRAEYELGLLNRKKEDLIQERRQRQKEKAEKLRSTEANPDERDKILEQHEQEVQRLENALESEKLRQRSYLEDRLAQRREKKRKAKAVELSAQAQAARKHKLDEERLQMEELARIEAAALQVSLSHTQRPVALQEGDDDDDDDDDEPLETVAPTQGAVVAPTSAVCNVFVFVLLSYFAGSGKCQLGEGGAARGCQRARYHQADRVIGNP
jgi:hypothetical protein